MVLPLFKEGKIPGYCEAQVDMRTGHCKCAPDGLDIVVSFPNALPLSRVAQSASCPWAACVSVSCNAQVPVTYSLLLARFHSSTARPGCSDAGLLLCAREALRKGMAMYRPRNNASLPRTQSLVDKMGRVGPRVTKVQLLAQDGLVSYEERIGMMADKWELQGGLVTNGQRE
ncbi:hypothetical protein LY78DRAFT_112677 [Colletotrichum sublineola]|nr:hypothetical protein LY78DRAFT_112677 [Colletotrichum sublineola]